MSRAFFCTETAVPALAVIDHGVVILNMYGVERSVLFAYAAADASRLAVLVHRFSVFGVLAHYPLIEFFGHKMNDPLRTYLKALPACRAFFLIDNGDSVFDRDRSESAGARAASETEAAARTFLCPAAPW